MLTLLVWIRLSRERKWLRGFSSILELPEGFHLFWYSGRIFALIIGYIIAVTTLGWMYLDPLFAASVCGLTVLDSYIAYILADANSGDPVGYAFGFLAFIIVFLAKSGYYLWLSVVILLLVYLGYWIEKAKGHNRFLIKSATLRVRSKS